MAGGDGSASGQGCCASHFVPTHQPPNWRPSKNKQTKMEEVCAFFHLDTSEEKACRETSASPFRSYGMNGCFYSQEAMNVPGAAVAITSFSCREEKKRIQRNFSAKFETLAN